MSRQSDFAPAPLCPMCSTLIVFQCGWLEMESCKDSMVAAVPFEAPKFRVCRADGSDKESKGATSSWGNFKRVRWRVDPMATQDCPVDTLACMNFTIVTLFLLAHSVLVRLPISCCKLRCRVTFNECPYSSIGVNQRFYPTS